jgi:hypothetical protein
LPHDAFPLGEINPSFHALRLYKTSRDYLHLSLFLGGFSWRWQMPRYREERLVVDAEQKRTGTKAIY